MPLPRANALSRDSLFLSVMYFLKFRAFIFGKFTSSTAFLAKFSKTFKAILRISFSVFCPPSAILKFTSAIFLYFFRI